MLHLYLLNPYLLKSRLSLLGTLILLLLTACHWGQDTPAADYAKRLSRVLNVDFNKSSAPVESPYPAFPSAQQSKLDDNKHTISIREFLGLRQCRLHLVIAERNSQIGKVATPSQRLKNDLEILATGPECLLKLDNQSLKVKLQGYLDHKQNQLQKNLWHALLAQEEYQKLWQQTSHQPNYPNELSSSTALEDLLTLRTFATKVLAGHYQFSNEEFSQIEQTLGRLRFGDGGQLLTELYQLRRSLETADSIVTQRLTQKLCIKPIPTNAARNLQNVVNKFFIHHVQAQAVKLVQRHKQLMPAIESLESLLAPHANADFRQWIADRDQLMEQGLNATIKHAKNMQAIYAQCGLVAGKAK